MTSEDTHALTEALLLEHGYYGLQPSQVPHAWGAVAESAASKKKRMSCLLDFFFEAESAGHCVMSRNGRPLGRWLGDKNACPVLQLQ